jgi:hypothetical protein
MVKLKLVSQSRSMTWGESLQSQMVRVGVSVSNWGVAQTSRHPARLIVGYFIICQKVLDLVCRFMELVNVL